MLVGSKRQKKSESQAVVIDDKENDRLRANGKNTIKNTCINYNVNFLDSTIWVPHLHLHDEQKIILQQKLWLDDVIMNAASKLLRQQFPSKKGLQSTLVAATSNCKLEGGATQILHVRSNHWVCVSK